MLWNKPWTLRPGEPGPPVPEYLSPASEPPSEWSSTPSGFWGWPKGPFPQGQSRTRCCPTAPDEAWVEAWGMGNCLNAATQSWTNAAGTWRRWQSASADTCPTPGRTRGRGGDSARLPGCWTPAAAAIADRQGDGGAALRVTSQELTQISAPWLSVIQSPEDALKDAAGSSAADGHEYDLVDLAKWRQAGGILDRHPLAVAGSSVNSTFGNSPIGASPIGRALNMERARGNRALTEWDGYLGSAAQGSARLSGALTRVFSPTRLESWSKCPFQFFLGNVLSLKRLGNSRRLADHLSFGTGHTNPQDTGAFHQRNAGVRPAVRGGSLGTNSHQPDRGHRRGGISRGRGPRRHRSAHLVGGGQGGNHPRPFGVPGERYGTAGPNMACSRGAPSILSGSRAHRSRWTCRTVNR